MTMTATEPANGSVETIEREKYPYRRDLPSTTLTDLRGLLAEEGESAQVSTRDLRISLAPGAEDDGDFTAFQPRISVGTIAEFPADGKVLTAIGNLVQVPTAFLLRQRPEMQQYLLRNLLDEAAATVSVRFTQDDILAVEDPKVQRVAPRRIVDAVGRVLSNDSQVIDFKQDVGEFSFDVVVPENFDRGVGGDLAIGDITRGGIRLFQDRKHNLAPQVQPFLHRAVCANGMETRDEGLKIDARGSSVEEVLADLEVAAERAFSQVEANITALYDLRNQRVENPERTLDRMLREMGLPDRTILALTRSIAHLVDEQGGTTMFDLVNHVTHAANQSGLRSGVVRSLQATSGAAINQHAARCRACQHVLV